MGPTKMGGYEFYGIFLFVLLYKLIYNMYKLAMQVKIYHVYYKNLHAKIVTYSGYSYILHHYINVRCLSVIEIRNYL